jgi:hypothetical protein
MGLGCFLIMPCLLAMTRPRAAGAAPQLMAEH